MKTDTTPTTPSATPPVSIDAGWSVNDTLLRYPETVEVFNTFAIDACCGGAASLDEAARESGVALDALLDALNGVARGAA